MITEKLNLWDRIFNRYRTEIYQEGTENWHRTYEGRKLQGGEYTRKYVQYKVIDRVTGSETLETQYL